MPAVASTIRSNAALPALLPHCACCGCLQGLHDQAAQRRAEADKELRRKERLEREMKDLVSGWMGAWCALYSRVATAELWEHLLWPGGWLSSPLQPALAALSAVPHCLAALAQLHARPSANPASRSRRAFCRPLPPCPAARITRGAAAGHQGQAAGGAAEQRVCGQGQGGQPAVPACCACCGAGWAGLGWAGLGCRFTEWVEKVKVGAVSAREGRNVLHAALRCAALACPTNTRFSIAERAACLTAALPLPPNLRTTRFHAAPAPAPPPQGLLRESQQANERLQKEYSGLAEKVGRLHHSLEEHIHANTQLLADNSQRQVEIKGKEDEIRALRVSRGWGWQCGRKQWLLNLLWQWLCCECMGGGLGMGEPACGAGCGADLLCCWLAAACY